MTFQIMKAVRRPGPNVKTRLRAFLDANEPQVVRMLSRVWNKQARDISYGDLIRAIERNEIDEAWLDDWRQDYSRFVAGYLAPAWETSMKAAADALHQKYPRWFFDAMAEGVQRWLQKHGAEFVTNVTRTQIEGIRAAVKYAASGAMTVDKLAQIVRPMIGLTRPQTTALSNYLNSMLQQGMSAKTARHKVLRRAEEMHRQRGFTIARTELAFAYNRGAIEGIRQTQKLGYIGGVQKKWRTAEDEHVCKICGTLNEALIEIDGEFDFPTRLKNAGMKEMPPAHPSCRCAVAFEEMTAEGAKTVVDYGEEVKGKEPVRLISEPAKRDEKRSDTGLQSAARHGIIEEIESESYTPLYAKDCMDEQTGTLKIDIVQAELMKVLVNAPELQRDALGFYASKLGEEMKATDNPDVLLGYDPEKDLILYNLTKPQFFKHDLRVDLIHELSHKFDCCNEIRSWKQSFFSQAIADARSVITAENYPVYLRYAENEKYGFLSDIFSAICENEYDFDPGHDTEYWNEQGAKEVEIFANLNSLETFRCTYALQLFQELFPVIWQSYCKIDKSIKL